MNAAVHVDRLTGDRPDKIRQQEADGVGHCGRVRRVLGRRRLAVPAMHEHLEAGDARGRPSSKRPGGDQVRPHPAASRSRARYALRARSAFDGPIQLDIGHARALSKSSPTKLAPDDGASRQSSRPKAA